MGLVEVELGVWDLGLHLLLGEGAAFLTWGLG
ncbi:hypothetical protein A8990_11338 [Paenibacillus taihuensis]|uniref:Uncharacterized protein n=1 Tax=Paenibacillus taihuensis TaxID=1156355 RepID=A0A3D9RYP1_9BACL|nr:hypothetical protein A8990_11338 [Paenibacillus taihuensis]